MLKNKLNTEYSVYMTPIPIGENSYFELKNPKYINVISTTRYWVVENIRTMRRFMSEMRVGIEIDTIEFFEINKSYHPEELNNFLSKNIVFGNIGVASEAGLPGMADPGSVVALWAHKHGVTVFPLVGPGSLMLALIASGLNGQQFTFHGYAPIKENELKGFITEISKQTIRTGYSQIFIEAPYRSDRFLKALLQHLNPEIYLCIAYNLHNAGEWIKTQTVQEWRSDIPELGKTPCVFIAGKPGQSQNS